MNDFTDKDEQTFLNTRAAGGNDRPAKTGWVDQSVQGRDRVQHSIGARSDMIVKQRGEGAHLLDALWLRTLGDVTSLRTLRFQCRSIGQMIAEHEISEMIGYLEESDPKSKNDRSPRKLDR
jgi:hypothetical protein